MEDQLGTTYREPKYTKMWLGLQLLYAFMTAGILTALTMGITSLAGNRVDAGLLLEEHLTLLSDSANYCFAVIGITLLSISLIELAFRKGGNLIQYILIGCALCLFYLLLLSISEFLPFWGAYLIVSAMTIGLISWFINAITHEKKATLTLAAILTAEYGLILLLIYLGSMMLLIGSIMIFALIGLAMYLTLKLKMQDEELYIK